ncbi:MAG: class I SAM-dependent methyltransferase [Verrucomicrobia bacterium]|nr:class I SAM-dependent methyltransferase [Verrucomicrobiota bacterium]
MATDEQGNTYPLHSSTSLAQCHFLQNIITSIGAKIGVEIGLAYGVSTLFICESLLRQGGDAARHYVMDPMQDDWRNIGLLNIKRGGYEKVCRYYRDYSFNVLPELLKTKVQADFAYIDSTKIFDILLVDVFLIHKILRVGGVLALDDCSFPGIRKLARLINRHPGWKLYQTFGPRPTSLKKRLLSKLCNRLPRKAQIFASNLLDLDSVLGLEADCIAFQKISEDTRHWSWHAEF